MEIRCCIDHLSLYSVRAGKSSSNALRLGRQSIQVVTVMLHLRSVGSCVKATRNVWTNVILTKTASISVSCSSLYLGWRIQLGASQNSSNTSFVVFVDEDCDDDDVPSFLVNSENDFLISAGAAGCACDAGGAARPLAPDEGEDRKHTGWPRSFSEKLDCWLAEETHRRVHGGLGTGSREPCLSIQSIVVDCRVNVSIGVVKPCQVFIRIRISTLRNAICTRHHNKYVQPLS
jgi:hypothetical protein